MSVRGVASQAGAVFKAAACAIPFIISPTGSMANNGAVTLGTALDTTYANAYLYLPANAINGANAAGWYFVQMSSSTVGTVFQNTYTTGQPSIPTAPTAWASTGPGAYTGVTTAVTGPQLSISALVGLNGALRISHAWGQPSTAGNKQNTLTFGGVTLYTAGFGTGATANLVSTLIQNRGVLNSQVSGPTNSNGTGFSGGAFLYSAINLAQAQTLTFQGQLATATDYIVMQGFVIEAIP